MLTPHLNPLFCLLVPSCLSVFLSVCLSASACLFNLLFQLILLFLFCCLHLCLFQEFCAPSLYLFFFFCLFVMFCVFCFFPPLFSFVVVVGRFLCLGVCLGVLIAANYWRLISSSQTHKNPPKPHVLQQINRFSCHGLAPNQWVFVCVHVCWQLHFCVSL